jgi:cell wall assembly regulator SMI1
MRRSPMSPRQLFPNGRFFPPATEEQIVRVETELGMRLPDQLRRLYFDCDGFREDRGNAKYLLSLSDEDHIDS